ncbi:monooxygenase [Dentipellis sp. KUC8613]|nr:monooxygenase [Dentipellis sp. KUC8613]
MSPIIDVLIVGAGPTGLVAALALAKNGVSVRIIEKLPDYPLGQRGAGIMPRTLEIYHFLGVLEDVKKQGTFNTVMKEWKDGKPASVHPMMTVLEPTPSFPERRPCILGQDAACSILREHLKAQGVDVELATELVRLEQREDSVDAAIVRRQDGKEVEETVTSKYVLGADGARGVVRKILDLSFLGETRDAVNIIIGDAEVYGLDQEHWHKFGDSPNDVAVLRPTNRSAKEKIFFYAVFGPNLDHAKALEDHEYLRQFVYALAKVPELKIGKFETISNYRPNIRVANSFRHGRVFIAGDAAHVHSATGGQGMNSSVMDAFNLGWKLALTCKGLATPALLDSYDAERLPVIKEMLQRTTALLNRTMAAAKDQSTSTPGKESESAWTRSTQLNQLGVHYRWSPVVVDEAVAELESQDKVKAEELTASTYVVEEGGRLHAGDRAPDAAGLLDLNTGGVTRLFDVFGPEHHTVLVFTDGEASSALAPLARVPAGLVRTVAIRSQNALSGEAAAGVDLVLHDRDGHAYPAYGAHVAVVRPDGVVGALVGGAEGVEKYFARVLSL